VKIEGFLPGAIPIRLEPIVESEVKTEPRLEGEPPNGYEVYSVTPSLPTVTVRGPAGHVNALEKAPTETISLAGQKASFTATNVSIDISDPKVDLLDPAVDVQIEIGERRVERSFSDVSVVGPSGTEPVPRIATVNILGPPKLLDQLKRNDIKIVLNAALEPQLELPPAFDGKLILKSVNPGKFTQLK
jgi:YbbR domain-containing protein